MKTILFSFALVLGLSACNKDAFHVDPAGVEQRLSKDQVEDNLIFNDSDIEIVLDNNSDFQVDERPCTYPELSKDVIEELRFVLQNKANHNCKASSQTFDFCHNGNPQTIRISINPTTCRQ